ncbi:MAG: hypothetical protein GXO88_06175 [Chlorobi bacterium]|nr:hypothetical protein [Chlorobiota bacterium]
MFNNKNRAFYNAAAVMGLDKIDENKSIDYLKSRFESSGITIDKGTTKYLLSTVANIPYYIQFIAYEIWQALTLADRNKVSANDIDRAVENLLLLKSDYYWELTNKQTVNRKKILYALSQSVTELFSKQTADNFNLGPVSSTQKALEVFVEDGIIERKNEIYEFSDPFYSTFIANNL